MIFANEDDDARFVCCDDVFATASPPHRNASLQINYWIYIYIYIFIYCKAMDYIKNNMENKEQVMSSFLKHKYTTFSAKGSNLFR